mmetsp:Transcript_14149/g.42173  ORF Transcript_14149/g.42173 Transcript_14149/m.42173 type:complete len:220 (-) Transcript_14149:308-967(-)
MAPLCTTPLPSSTSPSSHASNPYSAATSASRCRRACWTSSRASWTRARRRTASAPTCAARWARGGWGPRRPCWKPWAHATSTSMLLRRTIQRCGGGSRRSPAYLCCASKTRCSRWTRLHWPRGAWRTHSSAPRANSTRTNARPRRGLGQRRRQGACGRRIPPRHTPPAGSSSARGTSRPLPRLSAEARSARRHPTPCPASRQSAAATRRRRRRRRRRGP